jgi:hypothetical protein
LPPEKKPLQPFPDDDPHQVFQFSLRQRVDVLLEIGLTTYFLLLTNIQTLVKGKMKKRENIANKRRIAAQRLTDYE